ncbi:unnamed protein product [Clavelina lepadiformis]|uniref:Uncharacterized protein n=1 Tax=Clavelina lepadiformis TaxID=159417 RepID=A0ABP0F3J1_CLALP
MILKSLSHLGLIVCLVSGSNERHKQQKGEKCTPAHPRTTYEGCALDYRDMTLWCDLTKLTQLPRPEEIKAQAPPSKSASLYMNDSCVASLSPEVLGQYKRLQVVSFSKNLLEVVKAETFSHQTEMKRLDLSHNRIIVIEPKAFKGVKSLLSLNLKNNKLSELDRRVFSNLLCLENLVLDNNELQAIHDDDLAHLTKLRLLSLKGNRISNIESEAFNETPMLNSIDLRNNKVKVLPDGLFSHLRHLHELLLSGNGLISTNAPTFIDWIQTSDSRTSTVAFLITTRSQIFHKFHQEKVVEFPLEDNITEVEVGVDDFPSAERSTQVIATHTSMAKLSGFDTSLLVIIIFVVAFAFLLSLVIVTLHCFRFNKKKRIRKESELEILENNRSDLEISPNTRPFTFAEESLGSMHRAAGQQDDDHIYFNIEQTPSESPSHPGNIGSVYFNLPVNMNLPSHDVPGYFNMERDLTVADAITQPAGHVCPVVGPKPE